MDAPSVEGLCTLLSRSRLLAAGEVRDVQQRWRTESGDKVADTDAFARWLTARQYLTDYQAGLLLKGKADRFFLNDYKLLERIGQGRMAGVYKAVHRLGQTVAIKVLPPSKAKDSNTFARFQREARLALKLKHANVVRTFQVAEDDGLHFLVMEYLDGETLAEVLKQRSQLAPAEATAVLHQALTGLQCLHEPGIIHRDLKPANLMLLPAGDAPPHEDVAHATVKILDVGLRRALFDEDAPADAPADLTTPGTMLGDPDYMAPEQARDAHGADVRSDLYSLGCVLYHALAGRPPFADSNLVKKMLRHATEAPRPLKEVNAKVSAGLQHVVDTLLAKDPAQRYPTPQAAARELEPFLGGRVPVAVPVQGNDYLRWVEAQAGTPVPAAAVGAPVAAPVAPARVPQVDVERVELVAPGQRRKGLRERLRVGQRDFTFLLVGIAGAVAAVVLGYLLTH